MMPRKRFISSLVWSVVGLAVPVQAQTPQFKNALQELYTMADSHNATLRSLQSAVVEAEAGVRSAEAAKLPDVSGQVSFSYLGNARLWNRHFGESTSAPMPHFGNNYLLRAQQVVYSGGALTAGVELAGQNARMAGLSAEEGTQQVRFLLAGLFLQLHNLRNGQIVYATNARLARQMMEQMQKRKAQGVSLRNDITRYELQLRQMELGQTTLADRERIVLRRLATALGVDSVQMPLLEDAAFDEAAVSAEAEDAWQQLALQRHTGLQKSALAVDMSRTREKLERAELLPHVALLAEDHLDGPITTEVPPINKNINYWFVGVGVTYNFSSLYKNNRKLRQARLATAVAQDRRSVALEEVGDAVHAAYVELGTARTALVTRQKSVQLALENYDVVSKRYANGLALITDLTDAAAMKLDAELALADARIELLYSLYRLKFAAGDL